MSGAGQTSKAEIEAVERDLYARLGLTPNATREELASAYGAVQGYLGSAPRDLRDWAKARSAEVDEAFALLSDPAALAGAVALVGAVERPARQPGGSATPPTRRATPPIAETEPLEDDDVAPDDEDDDALIASVTPGIHRDTIGSGSRKTRAAPKPAVAKTRTPGARAPRISPRTRRARLIRRAAAGVVAIAAVILVAIAGYNFGPGAAAAQPSPSTAGGAAAAASPSPSLDTQQVAALMQKIAADPKDTTSLLGLANLYFRSGDYKTAADFASRTVTADPKNAQGFVALGAAQYNQGDETNAEKSWKQAISLDPKSVEAHYDLGFLYFAAQPQNKDGAITEWRTVISLDPRSDLATSLQAHLSSLTGSPAPSGSVAPSGSPAASGAGSPAASASPSPSASSQP